MALEPHGSLSGAHQSELCIPLATRIVSVKAHDQAKPIRMDPGTLGEMAGKRFSKSKTPGSEPVAGHSLIIWLILF